MQAGRMKYRLVLLKPAETSKGKFGSKKPDFIETVTVHAERVKLNGHRSEELGEHFPDYHVEFNIRDAHEVKENWRAREIGGYEYTITNIIPNRDRGMLTLICDRLND